ncbi:hypothetical protein ACKVMT_09355 [Halobacteriales archaeon Cl-PHB]
MSTTDTSALVAAYDDPAEPSEVTLYPTGADDVTEWITADVDLAVDLDDAV